MPEIDEDARNRLATAREHEPGQFDDTRLGVTLQKVAALGRAGCVERALDLGLGRLVVALGRCC